MTTLAVPPVRPRLWVVDDSQMHATAAARALAARYDVEVFGDGATAVERLSVGAPDVLVLDWNMPDVSGLEVCRYARLSRDRSDLPILILTANEARDDLVSAFEAGANDYVCKPFDGAELNARVDALDRERVLSAQLRVAEATLREDARYRERFIAALSHDLKQPLTSITATAQAMVKADDQSQRAGRIYAAALRMGRMLEDVLDLSRSRLGSGMSLRRTRASLASIAEGVAEEARGAHRGLLIETSYGSGDLTADLDADRIAQVCSNLLDNARKHGDPEGSVKLVITGDERALTMTVENAGPEIPESTRPSLFDAFRQGSTTSAQQGLGLGLFIVDQIVRGHGGSVEASSHSGITTFTVTLPRSTVNTDESERREPPFRAGDIKPATP